MDADILEGSLPVHPVLIGTSAQLEGETQLAEATRMVVAE